MTVVVPHDGDIFTDPVYAGCHRLNGNGELTGLEWIREAGLLTGPIGITNTHSVGIVHDGIIRHAVGGCRSGHCSGPRRSPADVGRAAERHRRLPRDDGPRRRGMAAAERGRPRKATSAEGPG